MFNHLKNLFQPKKKLDPNKNYCLDCGACCAYFKVYFPKNESSDNGGLVPAQKITFYDKKHLVMKGREKFRDGNRCSALDGEIGKEVSCNIYENRPSVCRAFEVVYANGKQNPRCRKAREFYGLTPDLE